MPASPLASQAREFDLLIKNGMILDGTGNPFYVADLGIKGERIAAIGAIDASRATRVIDATGLYVTPGFIDMHSHSGNRDGAIDHAEGRKAANSVTQGITTETINPPWPVAEQLARYRRNGHALNEVVSVNFGQIREMALGLENRPPTPAELERMRALIRQGFAEGARYIFVNLENGIPDRFALTDELVEIAKTVRELGGYYDTHQRSEGITPIWYNPSGQDYDPRSQSPVVDGVDAVRETIEIAERSGVKIVGHHVKVKGPNFWRASRSYVELMDRARTRGAQVYFSIYGYTSYGNWPGVAVIPPWALADPGVHSRLLRGVPSPYANARANFQRVLSDPARKRSLLIDVEHQFTKAGGPDRLLLVEYPDKQYTGKTLQQIADLRNEDPMDALFWLQLNGENRPGGGGWRALDTDDIDVEHFIQQDFVAYCTDGGMIVPGEGYPHPRYYGIFPRFIRRYALDRQVVKLPFLIRGMTSLAAQIIGLEDRGLLRVGYYADINVFDPVTIRDYATYMNPHQYSTGFRYVMVNGTLVVYDEQLTGGLPGRILTGTTTKTGKQ
ncbi:MAG: amidohydrolase family protein [Gemmatimonadetes bacterium]|nr:amidohydrolase family protein [Gemmatimonadota bacterium]